MRTDVSAPTANALALTKLQTVRAWCRPVVVVILVLLCVGGPSAAQDVSSHGSAHHFTGDRTETERFLGFNDNIILTAEQEATRVTALSALPAPCCAKFSAATCCCECNLTRATWGLAKYLIAEKGFNADQVRETVGIWHRTVNPHGFSGNACFSPDGCSRSFAANGCGGMNRDALVY